VTFFGRDWSDEVEVITRNYQIPVENNRFLGVTKRQVLWYFPLIICKHSEKKIQVRSNKYDVVVIGAGIIGLSTAMNLLERFPKIKLAVIEKNVKEGTQQSGHNSGVIHSGIYY